MSLNIARPSSDDMVRVVYRSSFSFDRSLTVNCQLRLQLHAWRRGLKTGIYYMRTRAPMYPLPYGVGAIVSNTGTEVGLAEGEKHAARECCSG